MADGRSRGPPPGPSRPAVCVEIGEYRREKCERREDKGWREEERVRVKGEREEEREKRGEGESEEGDKDTEREEGN